MSEKGRKMSIEREISRHCVLFVFLFQKYRNNCDCVYVHLCKSAHSIINVVCPFHMLSYRKWSREQQSLLSSIFCSEPKIFCLWCKKWDKWRSAICPLSVTGNYFLLFLPSSFFCSFLLRITTSAAHLNVLLPFYDLPNLRHAIQIR